jgi:hypothetical protein
MSIPCSGLTILAVISSSGLVTLPSLLKPRRPPTPTKFNAPDSNELSVSEEEIYEHAGEPIVVIYSRITPRVSSVRRRAIRSTLAVISFKISRCRIRKNCAVAGDDLLRVFAPAINDFLQEDIASCAMSSNIASCYQTSVILLSPPQS